MNNLKMTFLTILVLLTTSCGEETLTKTQQKTSVTATDISTFEVTNRSLSRLEKPPVDILYVVDNSGSTLVDSFQALRSQIQNTLSSVSNEFDFHIYFTPLVPSPGDNISAYPLIVSDESTVNGGSLNITTISNLSPFSPQPSNNVELGFQRALTIIDNNRSNKIFRQNAHTIIVMISNGDDTESVGSGFNGSTFEISGKMDEIETEFRKLTKQHSPSGTLQADTLRFISLVAHSNCSFAKAGNQYRKMSERLYNYQGFSDNDGRDSFDLCSGDFTSLFSSVNSSIRQVLVEHQYDHWLISTQTEASINPGTITLTKVNGVTGAETNIPSGGANGFEYLGARTNINTRFLPDAGEPVTGLVVKLNGTARVKFPDYIRARTTTPTEYFGFISLPREPELSTIEVIVNGTKHTQSSSNGWTYLGFRPSQNTKVVGPNGESDTPALNKSGYFVRLHGNAIYTSGDTVQVFFKAKAL